MDGHVRLQDWWSRTRAGITTASVAESLIVEIEARYCLTIPREFRDYLTHSCPVGLGWDQEDGIWWDIDRIRNIPDEYEHEIPPWIPDGGRKFLFFMDYCIWCWAWAISCADDESRGKIVVIRGSPERFVADSFSQFVDRYTTDWVSVI